MKKTFKLLPILLAIVFYSCDKKDEGPTIIPNASFSQNRQFIEPGESVTYTNNSTDFESLEWDFGDNRTSTEENPEHFFTTPGVFSVTLTVTSSSGDVSIFSSDVTVGSRWTTGIVISEVPLVNQSNDPWDDDGSGPELLFGFSKVSAATVSPFNIGDNLTADDFPRGGAIQPSGQVALTNEVWRFAFFDNDEPFNDLAQSNLMQVFEFNPVTIESVKDYQDGSGSFEFSQLGFRFTMVFEIRN